VEPSGGFQQTARGEGTAKTSLAYIYFICAHGKREGFAFGPTRGKKRNKIFVFSTTVPDLSGEKEGEGSTRKKKKKRGGGGRTMRTIASVIGPNPTPTP